MNRNLSLQSKLRALLDTPLAKRAWWFWIFAVVLFPIALLWALVAAWRRSSFVNDVSLLPKNFRVLCVGNVVAGGAGKSPVVRQLAKQALRQGHKVAIISRGVGRRNVLCTDNFTDVQYLMCDELAEHVEFLSHLGHLYIVQNPDRYAGILQLEQLLVASGAPKILCLLDDGMQHFGCPRHTDICVMDVKLTAPVFPLPIGPYREGLGHWITYFGMPSILLNSILGPRVVKFWSRDTKFEQIRSVAALKCQELELDRHANEGFVVSNSCFFKVIQNKLVGFEPIASQDPWHFMTGVAHWKRILLDLHTSGLFAGEVNVIAFADHAELPTQLDRFLGRRIVMTGKDFCRWHHHPALQHELQNIIVIGLNVEILDCHGAELDWRTL